MKHSSFHFESATFHPRERRADFCYAILRPGQKPLRFKETLSFPAGKIQTLPAAQLKTFLKDLHLVLGLSYYKLYCPPTLKVPYTLSKDEAAFWNTVYEKGLGEFFFRNKIDFRGLIRFPSSAKAQPVLPQELPTEEKVLLGIGGGKDSIVAGELLRERKLPCTAFILETGPSSPIAEDVIRSMKLKKLVVRRSLDAQLFAPPEGAFNGHIPISAIFAFVGVFTAALYGFRYVAVGNEASSNVGNARYLGTEINHQWSKSAEFEALLQGHLRRHLTPSVEYFSAIRHFYEIRTVQTFVRYPEYFKVFSSCNRNFRVHKDRPAARWCGECPKCAFVFGLMAAFLPPQKLIPIFGKNLFEEKALLPLWKDLAGLGSLKPFDCVGTFEETRAALRLAAPEWGKTTALKTLLPLVEKNFPNESADQLLAVQDAPTLPAHLKFLGLSEVLLLGYGKEGRVTERYLKKYYPKLRIRIADQGLTPTYLDEQKNAEFAVKTPGLPKQQLNIPYTTATNIFFAQNRAPTVGVTGSKGKSTTASLVAHLLNAGGVKAQLLGNIGKPMLEALLNKQASGQVYVLELSSYQLDDCTRSPHVAIVTNLFPEHMSYHGGIEPYYAAKKNILLHQSPADFFIVNPKHPLLKTWTKEARGGVLPFSNGQVPFTPLLGEHNRSNVAAALAAAELFKIPRKTLTSALRDFKALPHRLENVGTHHGITFYDDAISTSPESTIEALKALTPLAPIGTLFLGGEDRGYDFTALEKALRRFKVKNLVLFPDTGDRLLRSTRGFTILRTTSMKEAVAFAFSHTPKGQLCVLSTASPSYTLWKNFEAKGDEFQKQIQLQARVFDKKRK